VTVVAVHVTVAGRDTSVTHKDHNLVDRLRVLAEVVPEHGRIVVATEVGGGVTLLGVDEVRELGGVPH